MVGVTSLSVLVGRVEGAAGADAFLHPPTLVAGVGGQAVSRKEPGRVGKSLDGGDGFAFAAAWAAVLSDRSQGCSCRQIGIGAGCAGQGGDGFDDRVGHTSAQRCATGAVGSAGTTRDRPAATDGFVDLGAVTAACLVLPGGDDDRRGDAVVFRPMHIETWQFENRLGQTDRIAIGAASQDEFHLVEDVEAMAGVTDKMSLGTDNG